MDYTITAANLYVNMSNELRLVYLDGLRCQCIGLAQTVKAYQSNADGKVLHVPGIIRPVVGMLLETVGSVARVDPREYRLVDATQKLYEAHKILLGDEGCKRVAQNFIDKMMDASQVIAEVVGSKADTWDDHRFDGHCCGE